MWCSYECKHFRPLPNPGKPHAKSLLVTRCFPTFWLFINSCVFTESNWLKLIKIDWNWLKLTEIDWKWQTIDRYGLKVDKKLGGKPLKSQKIGWRFRMEGGAKKSLSVVHSRIACAQLGCRKRGVESKGGSLRDGFGGFDGFGGAGEHRGRFDGFGSSEVVADSVVTATPLNHQQKGNNNSEWHLM